MEVDEQVGLRLNTTPIWDLNVHPQVKSNSLITLLVNPPSGAFENSLGQAW